MLHRKILQQQPTPTKTPTNFKQSQNTEWKNSNQTEINKSSSRVEPNIRRNLVNDGYMDQLMTS